MNTAPAEPRRRKRRWIKVSAALCGAVLIAVVGWATANWTFVSRLVTFPMSRSSTAIEWYEPLEEIPGAFSRALPSGAAEAAAFDRARLELASNWADAHESCSLLVLHRGVVVFERYWRGCHAQRRTVSHSLAKTLLGLLVGVSIARGEVGGLGTPVSTCVTEWSGTREGEITVGHLLWMESGLHYSKNYNPLCDMVRVHLEPDLVPILLAMHLEVPPGTRFQYNNLNTQLLGLFLERATGRRYASLLSERIWQPIHARDAAVWLDRERGNAKVYGAVLATARDWARVGELIRNLGRVGDRQVVPAAWIERMEQPAPHRGSYGLHLWRSKGRPDAGVPPYVYLDGRAKQRVFVLRGLELVIVRTGEDSRSWNNEDLLALILAARSTEGPR